MSRAAAKSISLAAVLLVCLLVLVPSQPPAQAATEPSGNGVIVQFAPGTSTVSMASAASAIDAAMERGLVARQSAAISFAVYSSDTLTVEQLVQRFRSMPGVVAVSPDYRRSIDLWPSDPRLGELWAMENTGQTGGTVDADIDAAAAWDITQGSGVVLACIDTGVDYDHPDLAANMWRNPGEIAGDGIDNDDNGHIDDIYGIDAYSDDSDPMDEHGHGTHVSGTMAAVGDNGVGVAGVAWRSKVMALRFLGADGTGSDSDAITCINYVIDLKLNRNINVVGINASWGGGGYNPVLLNAIRAAGDAGIVFVAAAGNNGLNNNLIPHYPSSYSVSNVVAVGATTSSDQRASYSNYGASSVDLFAPGSGILSTYRGGYETFNGTSMATPHVSGVVGLLAALHPGDTPSTSINRILLTVDRLSALDGWCVTGGRLNAGVAVATAAPTIVSVAPTSGSVSGGTSVVVQGAGFMGVSGGDAVTFGGVAATSYTVDSATRITATAPARAAGGVSIRVTGAFGSSADTANDDYTYVPVPAVTGLAPSFGPTAGGNDVVISGTGLLGATQVFFGSAAIEFAVESDTRVVAKAPAHAWGSVRVRVVSAGGTSPDTIADDYLFADRPVVSGISPNVGPASGGTQVVINGGSFTGATAVSFGGTAATSFSVDSATRLTATAPGRAAGTISIQVTGPAGVSEDSAVDDYTFVAPPMVTGLALSAGPTAGGSVVLVNGSGFVGLSGPSAVTFGGVDAAEYDVVSDTLVSAVTPPGMAGTVRVKVTAVGGTSADTAGDDFTYESPPLSLHEQTDEHIEYAGNWAPFSTASASAGSYGRANTAGSTAVIVFEGDRLDWIAMKGTTTGKADVYLDGEFQTTVDLAASVATYQVNVWTTGLLPNGRHEVKIARNAGNARSKYITLDRVEVLGNLVYVQPAITSLSPATGTTAGGSRITIHGSGFKDVTAVMFGSDPASPLTVDSSAKITATAPAHPEGAVRVKVVAAGGETQDTTSDDFTYTTAPPVTRVDAKLTDAAYVRTGSWANYSKTEAFSGSYLRSATAGATVVIPFHGTQLDWIAMKGTTTGKADVYLDNVFKTTIDLASGTAAYQVNVWSTGILPSGYHTVKIVRSSSNTAGKFITVDAVDVAGELARPVRLEETASLFVWNPAFASWTTGTTSLASGGAYTYTNTAGAKITVNFTGVSLNLLARTAPNYGRVRVTVDGGTPFTVDLYSSTAVHKKVVWRSGFLIPGDHTVTIERLGTKNTRSSGYTIDLDAIDLTGEPR